MKNPTLYLEGMEKSYQEKLFFTEHLDLNDYDFIVDFGCANGHILRRLYNFIEKENIELVGFDSNLEFLEIAREVSPSSINFTNSVSEIIPEYNQKSLIIFNSVFHEIVNEYEREAIIRIMSEFDAIVIRDMIAPVTSNLPIDSTTHDRIANKVPKWMFEEFEERWGRIDNKKKMYHLFLKYTYIENWETELEEDYFSAPWGELYERLVFEGNYKIAFERTYTLEYKKKMVEKDFNHLMNDITHKQIIYTREAKL